MSDAALSMVAPFAHPDRLFIGGEWLVPSARSKIDVVCPSNEELYVSVAEAQAEDVDRAVAAARAAFDHGPWPMMSHSERAQILHEVARLANERALDFSSIWTCEIGVAAAMSRFIGVGSAGVYDYYASLAGTFPFVERHKPGTGEGAGFLVREPVGVVAAIIPWNAAPMTMAYKIAPALLAGCTVIVKASPESPGAVYVMAEIMAAAGLPAGVFNMLTADREVSELLVRHPGVDKVTFTGSSAAGKKIGAICAERVARCTLELGGKSAALVLDDADIALVAKTLAASTPRISGQVCSSLTRIVVNERHHDALVEALAAEFATIKVGDPFDDATDMGPLAMKRQRERVEHFIELGRAEGAVLAAGGKRPAHLDRGYYVEPTIFSKVQNDMTIAREEIFGPVVSVIPAPSDEAVVDIANDSVFGLNGSVFTRDVDRAYRVARRLRTGTVGHNAFRTDFSIAFGGFKQSGIGREGGTEGLMPFLEAKTVILEAEPTQL